MGPLGTECCSRTRRLRQVLASIRLEKMSKNGSESAELVKEQQIRLPGSCPGVISRDRSSWVDAVGILLNPRPSFLASSLRHSEKSGPGLFGTSSLAGSAAAEVDTDQFPDSKVRSCQCDRISLIAIYTFADGSA